MFCGPVRHAVLVMAVIAGISGGLVPADSAPKTPIGPVTLDYGKISYSGSSLELFGGVSLKSESFDLGAEKMKVTMATGKEAVKVPHSIAGATAVGDPAKGTQVTGRFEQVAEGRTIRVQADQAVYAPESGRPGGGRVDFTGHVKMILSAPLALAEPSVTETEHMVVLLGPAPEYPRIEGARGHMTLTPLN